METSALTTSDQEAVAPLYLDLCELIKMETLRELYKSLRDSLFE